MRRLQQPVDPYRVLFPLGLFLGIVGVLLWPLFVYGVWPTYPAAAHARIMITGFAASFVLGFMSTALPHMLEAPRFTRLEVLCWVLGLLSASVFYFFHRLLAGDAVFLIVLIIFAGRALARWPYRKDIPPPGFVGAMLGLLCAVSGVALQLADAALDLPDFVFLFSKLLLYQGFLLLPVLGIGAFILPVFMGYDKKGHKWRIPNPPSVVVEVRSLANGARVFNPPTAWWKEAATILGVALILIGSFALEASGSIQAGYILRIAVLLVYFSRYLPVHRRQKIGGALSWHMRWALIFILSGYALAAIWHTHYMAWLHVVFMTGFGLLIFGVAGRVILGHGGQQPLFKARWPSLWVVFGLIVLAMATRVSADWMPETRFNHYAYAALCWIPAAILWGIKMFRYIMDEE